MRLVGGVLVLALSVLVAVVARDLRRAERLIEWRGRMI